MSNYEIKEHGGWFSIYCRSTGKLRHIGGATRASAEEELKRVEWLDSPDGEEWAQRVKAATDSRNRYTGD